VEVRTFRAASFGYDALGRVTSYAGGGTTTQTYAYDASGNRAAFTQQIPPNYDVALSYNYDKGSNRLLGIVGGPSSESFTYDANGNMLSHAAPFGDYTYTYDARNRRTQAYVGAYATTDVVNGLGPRPIILAPRIRLPTPVAKWSGCGTMTPSAMVSQRGLPPITFAFQVNSTTSNPLCITIISATTTPGRDAISKATRLGWREG